MKLLSRQFSGANEVIVKKLENVSLLSQVTFNTLTKKIQICQVLMTPASHDQ